MVAVQITGDSSEDAREGAINNSEFTKHGEYYRRDRVKDTGDWTKEQ